MNAPLRIGLLMVGHVDPKSQHIGGDYPELFGALLEPLGIDLVRYDLDEGRFPNGVHECDGWICSPSRLSTYDPVAWLPDVEELLRRIVAAEVPYVGICFGHQLLAQALGGRVAKADYGWGVGIREYEVVEQRAWMTPSLNRVRLIGSHQDQVMELPPGAELLFRSDYCPNGGFAIGERAWTIQVHPEFIAPLADHLLAGRIELIGAERVAQARASLGGDLDRHVVAQWMHEFFLSSSRTRRSCG
jgi:GMP synthase-like glutamine amidotransferase